MNPAEQIAFLHASRAAFRSGAVDAGTYLSALLGLGTSGVWDGIDLARTFLAEAKGNFLSTTEVPLFEQKVRSAYGQRFAKAGQTPRPGERPENALLRVSLTDMMTRVGKDPATLHNLSVMGANRLKPANPKSKAAAPPAELLSSALWAAIHTGGVPVMKDAIASIEGSTDAEFRLVTIRALSAARDPAAIELADRFAISGALRVRELTTYLREAFGDAERRDSAWVWLRKDFDTITAPVPLERRARFIDMTSSLCTDTAEKEIDAFFTPLAAKITGAPRTIANAMEAAASCNAWRKKAAAEMSAALRLP
jgi:hypothetical protein